MIVPSQHASAWPGRRKAGCIRTLAAAVSVAIVLLSGCLGRPEGVEPVRPFELDRYLGKWFEIARLDHPFERGLQSVTAEYSLRDDGGIRVRNRGYSSEEGAWRETEGKAYFVDRRDEGYLKVSFFGPFYGSYVVFGLDQKDYQYSFVTGPNKSYLWLLARTPAVPQEIVDTFIAKARQLGYNTGELIFVEHE